MRWQYQHYFLMGFCKVGCGLEPCHFFASFFLWNGGGGGGGIALVYNRVVF